MFLPPSVPVIIQTVPNPKLELSTHLAINAHRKSKGLNELIWDSKITQQSRNHSIAMALNKVPFSHEGFNQRSSALLPWLAIAENVHQNTGFDDPVAKAIESWLLSPSHKANIEGQYTHTGIGIAKSASGTIYFTQIFVRR